MLSEKQHQPPFAHNQVNKPVKHSPSLFHVSGLVMLTLLPPLTRLFMLTDDEEAFQKFNPQ